MKTSIVINSQDDWSRAKSLQLAPRKRQTNPRCKVIIEPERGIDNAVDGERITQCIAARRGRR